MIMVRFMAILDTAIRVIIGTVLTRVDCPVRMADERSTGTQEEGVGAGTYEPIPADSWDISNKHPLCGSTPRARLCESVSTGVRTFKCKAEKRTDSPSAGSAIRSSAIQVERKSWRPDAPRLDDTLDVPSSKSLARSSLVEVRRDDEREAAETQSSECVGRNGIEGISWRPEVMHITHTRRPREIGSLGRFECVPPDMIGCQRCLDAVIGRYPRALAYQHYVHSPSRTHEVNCETCQKATSARIGDPFSRKRDRSRINVRAGTPTINAATYLRLPGSRGRTQHDRNGLSVGNCELIGGAKLSANNTHPAADSCEMGPSALGEPGAYPRVAAPVAEIDMYLASATQANDVRSFRSTPVGCTVPGISSYAFAAKEPDRPSGMLRSRARPRADGGEFAVKPQESIWPIGVGLTRKCSLRSKLFPRWMFNQCWTRGP
jgi:hypothetical protein